MAQIILAENSGFCFGVKRAIEKTEEQMALKAQSGDEGRVFTCGPLIHNALVTDDLKARGCDIINNLSEAGPMDTVIVRSHGEPEEFFKRAAELGISVVDATCPFVSKIHELVSDAHAKGYRVVIVGDRNHPEVIGTNGWCENAAIIVSDENEARDMAESLTDAAKSAPEGLFAVAQTTIQKSTLEGVLSVFDGLELKYTVQNTICSATTLRQESTAELSSSCDAMIIIGGKDSSNTKKLFEIAKKTCKNTFFVEKTEDLFLHDFAKCNRIGVAAGASTPERVIKEVIATMNEKENMSMEELLATENYDLDSAMKLPKLGVIVNGTVHQVTEKQIVVDMGCKKDGIIPKEEVTLEGEEKLTDLFKAGDEIQAKVIKTDDGDGVITLSTKKLDVNKHWNEIKDAMENGDVLNVKVVRCVNGGVIAQYKEASGFIPLSQLSDRFVEKADEYIGQEMDVKVISFEEKNGKPRAAFSRKAILKAEKAAKLAAIWENLHVDDIVEGKVMRFTDYGAFIDLGGIDGLLHISEISWGKLRHPQEVLKIGETVKVKILSMNEEKGKISLGLKQTTPAPWEAIDDKYEVGQVVEGTIVSIMEYGAFVELEPGLDGLVHISEVAHKRVTNIKEELTVGQKVETKILEIDKEKQRISLSIKATLPEPEEAPAEEAPVDEVVEAAVTEA